MGYKIFGDDFLSSALIGIGFTWGGLKDIRALFKSLKQYKVDDSDNGTVEEHKSF